MGHNVWEETLWDEMIGCHSFLFIMASNSTVFNNESDSTITIINEDYSLVIKEVFSNTMLLT
jgi:hypothetical protein